ncbi:MAG: hypothetical protein OXI51_03745 [Chloroflexota bacterium]|nr:hypothetical protein [Chloroflexota bacterium]
MEDILVRIGVGAFFGLIGSYGLAVFLELFPNLVVSVGRIMRRQPPDGDRPPLTDEQRALERDDSISRFVGSVPVGVIAGVVITTLVVD